MNFLTKLSLKRPVSVCLVVLALLIFGMTALVGMPMELMPEVNMPMLMIMTVYPGAAPRDVE
ncbi:MAG: efflux RND transporter permease subunit, partial [Oscillospiraceae bacterium]